VTKVYVVIVLFLIAASFIPKITCAEGAVAVGSTGNVAKDGIAIGSSTDWPTKAEAIAHALKNCQTSQNAPAKVRALCKIVQTFTRQCFATATDPKDGTPGFGWALGPDQTTAKALALAACQASAGNDRRTFCESLETICDTRDDRTN
jgi:hypothetical protein